MTLIIALIILLTLITIEWKFCKNFNIKTFYFALLSAIINLIIANLVDILTWDHRCLEFFTTYRKPCSYSEHLFGGLFGSLPFILESLAIFVITILTIYILNYFKNGGTIPNPRIIFKKYKFSFLALLINAYIIFIKPITFIEKALAKNIMILLIPLALGILIDNKDKLGALKK